MQNCRHPNPTSVLSLAVVAVLFEAASAFGACDVPHYRTGRTWADKASEIDVAISIRLEDFAPERLICLAWALRQKYPGRNIAAYMFSSREAALGYLPTSIDPSPKVMEYQSKLHGYYSYNRDRHEDYLLIMPDGTSQDLDSPLATRMDLPVTGTPVCRLAINGRCLLEFQTISYPTVEGRAEISGRVTLGGSIPRNGALSEVAVVDANVSPPERQSVLLDWARQNFSTWRFAPSRHKDAVRITYYFEVVDGPLMEHGSGVQFRLPDEVRIQTCRPH